METFYLSGPMRGREDYNYQQFNEVEDVLRRTCPDDKVVNPARNFGGDTTLQLSTYMTEATKQVADCTVIMLLPDWRTSEGSKYEVRVGVICGKRFAEATREADGGWIFDFIASPIDPELGGNSGSIRAAVLAEASRLVTGDRNNQYGPPGQDFTRSSDAASAMGYRWTELPVDAPPCKTCGARRLMPHDTALWIGMVKVSRLMWQPGNPDSWVDAAGYFGCGAETAGADPRK